MAFTTAGKNAALDAIMALITHVALFVGDPEGAGAEVSTSGTNYARAAKGSWSAASASETHNSAQINFGAPSGNWGAVSHFAFYTAVSAGTRYASAALTNTKNVNNGDSAPYFAASALSVTAS